MTPTVLIVDRHQSCRTALAAAILGDGGFRIAGSIAQVGDHASSVLASGPDAVVIGASQPDESDAIRAVHAGAPNARVIVISQWVDGPAVVAALRAGALGYMPEWAGIDEIVEAIRRGIAGSVFVHPDAATNGLAWAVRKLYEPAEQPSGPLQSLSARERRILDLLEDGLAPAQIASRLFLSKRTVESHLRGAYTKLSVHGRLEALWEYKRLRRDVSEHVS